MNEPNKAPLYACLYPGLCDIARKLGYALTIHGTLNNDCDFVAIPWTEEAVEDVVLVEALKKHIGALYLYEKVARDHNENCLVSMHEVDSLILAAMDEKTHSMLQLDRVTAALKELRQKASTPEHPYNLITGQETRDPTAKPHGRKAWNLHLDHGAKIDLSVMPRSRPAPVITEPENKCARCGGDWDQCQGACY